jgi:DNA-binding MarR family transcriptional regulator
MSSVSTKRHAADRMHSAAIHLLRRARQADEVSMHITPARASALSVLVFAGPQTLTDLAEAEQVTTATMSKLVAALEREGFVRRERHATDGRAIRLHPTAQGRRILARGREQRLNLLEGLFEQASDDEIRTVREAAEIVDRLALKG